MAVVSNPVCTDTEMASVGQPVAQHLLKEIVKETRPPQKIRHIQFGLLSAATAVRVSEIQVVNRELYEMPKREPMPYGCLDLRLGTSNKSSFCGTCGERLAECPGHFGYIKLEMPVFHIGFFKALIAVLQVICKTCSRVLLSNEDATSFKAKLSRQASGATATASTEVTLRRLISKKILDTCSKVKTCMHCGAVNGSVKKVGAFKIIHERYKYSPLLQVALTTAGSITTTSSTIGVATGPAMNEKLLGDLRDLSLSRLVCKAANVGIPESLSTTPGYISNRPLDLPSVFQEDLILPTKGGKVPIAATQAMAAARFLSEFEAAVEANRDLAPFLSKAQESLSPIVVLDLLSRISNDDCALLDMNPTIGRPEAMVLTHLLVPPVCIRPSVQMDGASGSNEDDLTIRLTEILHINQAMKLALQKGAAIQLIMEDWEYLQLQCAVYINSELPGLPPTQQSSKPTRSFVQRLKGKTGRFRGNLSGKRVDYSGRTVISPDPNLRIDEVGVPVHIARTLTYPAQVNTYNIEFMRLVVRNGPDEHPGANFVELKDGTKRFLKYGDRIKLAAELRPGDKVERHLMDGDVVLFNRQPSLHKVSIMAHRARIMPHRTLRFNECVCAPYNADFDGDEMNLHVPQTEEARAEAATLMSVVHNMVTPRNGELLIAPTQDFLTACHILTRRDCFLTRSQFGQLMATLFDALTYSFDSRDELQGSFGRRGISGGGQSASVLAAAAAKEARLRTSNTTSKNIFDSALPPGGMRGGAWREEVRAGRLMMPAPTIIHPLELWTGKQIFHVLLRPGDIHRSKSTEVKANHFFPGGGLTINVEVKTKSYTKDPLGVMCPNEGYVLFCNSELLAGALDKTTTGGGGKKSLFYALLHDYGPHVAAECMNAVARVSARFLTLRGFSIGISDVMPSSWLQKKKRDVVTGGYDAVNGHIEQFKANELPLQPGCDLDQSLEAVVSGELSQIREKCGSLCLTELAAENSLNAPLIMAVCGSKGSSLNISQMVACVGQQVVSGTRIPNGFVDRSLPHFAKNAKDPAAKGFVENSFFSGLSPTEFFFHTISGREGLVDTAVKTAETGYMQRRLMKALEDLSVQYDRTVRNSVGGIVQFTYGGDGLDPTMMETNPPNSKPVSFSRILQNIIAIDGERRQLTILEATKIKAFLPSIPRELIPMIPGGFPVWNEPCLCPRDLLRVMYEERVKGHADDSLTNSNLRSTGMIRDLRAFLRERSLQLESELLEFGWQTKCRLSLDPVWTALAADGNGVDDGDDLPDLFSLCETMNTSEECASLVALESLVVSTLALANGVVPPLSAKIIPNGNIVSEMSVGQAVGYRLWSANSRLTRPRLVAFFRSCCDKWRRSEVEPGTAVGAIGAQSIGEPGTQMTLKTFHFAGVASMNVTLGVPRIKEIINAAKNISTPIITAPLVQNDDLKAARIVKARLEKTTLGEIAEFIKEVYSSSGLCYLVIKLDMVAISNLQLGIDLLSVREAILKAPKLGAKIKDKHVRLKSSTRLLVYPPEMTRSTALHALQALKMKLPHVIVKGIPTVQRAVINTIDMRGEGGKARYNLLVEGYDLAMVMGTPGVFAQEAKSNHIIEMEQTLGIEAARLTIVDEIQYTMSSHGMSIDPRHVMLLADLMTFKGEINGITRFGIRKMKDSVLMLASFEQTSDHLFDAAVHARKDSIDGVSECIIMGVPVPVGSGMMKVVYDLEHRRPCELENQRPKDSRGSEAVSKLSETASNDKNVCDKSQVFEFPRRRELIFAGRASMKLTQSLLIK